MQKIILICEDLPNEQETAKQIAEKLNFRFVVASNLNQAKLLINSFSNNIAGIVTDIHFPVGDDNISQNQPNGLSVIAKAVELNIPVSVCSDINGHYAYFLKDLTNVLEKYPSYKAQKIPTTIGAKN